MAENLRNKFWFRLLEVLYIIVYLTLPLVLSLSFLDFGRTYHSGIPSYQGYYTIDWGAGLVALAITFLIFVLVVELVKSAVLYLLIGKGYRSKVKSSGGVLSWLYKSAELMTFDR